MQQVKCPMCNRLVPWSEDAAFRPFCSERCKLIDLGAWAADSYAVAGRHHGTESTETEADRSG
jgi:endogenous inhibitor of DNA gyrase (YacG/DUF329 family)